MNRDESLFAYEDDSFNSACQVTDDLDPGAFGSWYHGVMHRLYAPFEGKEVDSRILDGMLSGAGRDLIKRTAEEVFAECGYRDDNVVKSELYYQLVLGDPSLRGVFPADKTGANVVFAQDVAPYAARKMRLLNGSHTALAAAAHLCGVSTVGEAAQDPLLYSFVREYAVNEARPTIADLSGGSTADYAESVLERFKNPYIRHELKSILQGGAAKYRMRILPVIKDYVRTAGKLPARSVFALAALCVVCGNKEGDICPNEARFAELCGAIAGGGDPVVLAREILADREAWGCDLNAVHPSFSRLVGGYIADIYSLGGRGALKKLSGAQ